MTPDSPIHRFGPFTLDIADRRLLRDGAPVAVRARAFDVLVTLVERAGRLVTKDELLDAVWSELAVEENNLQVQVSALRRLLGPGWIDTVPGRGYRFTGAATSPAPAAAGAAPGAGATDVPAPVGPLVGRDAEVARISAALAAHRLVTVTGPGGIGKTRVAQAVAQAVRGRFADGCAWIALADVADPALATGAVAAALGLAATPDPAAAVAEALRGRERLLVFDNAEHVLEHVAPLVTRVLERAPRVRALVTSQAPCGVGGEHVHRLAPLALPAPGADAAAAAGAAAVELFVARARALVGDFRLDDGNTGTVVELCRRLDGLPLALELAAGRLPALGLAALADGLEQRFRVLAAARPGTPERQRTLEAVLDWSYGLLGDDERAVFRRLGLLGATFTLEDAVAVGGDAALDAWAVAAIVGDLVDRSLVVALASEPPVYTLLETGRAYARTRLAPATDGPHIARAIDHLERDALRAAAASDNARALRMASAALELAGLLPAGADRDTRELELGIALGPVLQTTVGPAHPRTEAVYRRASQLAAGRPADERAFMAQWGLWQFLSMAGRDAEAATHTDAIVRTAGALGDEALVLEAHHARLTTWQLLGRAPEAVASAREVIARYDRDRHHALAFRFGGHDPGACALGQGAVALWLAGRPDEAADLATRALALGESMDHAYSRGCAYFYAAFTWCALGRDAEFDRATTALAALCERHTMDMLSNEALLLGGRARWRRGDAAGIADMERALDTIDAGGDYAFAILYATLLVDALIATGRWDDAAGRMTGAAAYSRDGQRFFLPELARLSGELRAARGDRDAAAADFAVALAQAREDGAAALALRAATSAAAHAAPAARDAALAALRDARALIEGGTTTPDVRRADALLAGATAAPPRRRR